MSICVENEKSKSDNITEVRPTDVFNGKVWYNLGNDRLEICIDEKTNTWINEDDTLKHLEIDIEAL